METFSASLALCAGNSPHKGKWRGALMFSLIYARINGWVNTNEAGDLRRNHVHYDVIVMYRMLCTKVADIGGYKIAYYFSFRNRVYGDKHV